MSINIRHIQTGTVRVKTAQRIRKPGGLLRVLTDSAWTDWLPIYAWVIDHPEGIIVVDTGETARTSDPDYFPTWHPYYRGSVRMNVRPEEEIGPQLRSMGIMKQDVKALVLTHFHTDHAGGLHHFPDTEILVSGSDYRLASGFSGRLLGYLPHRWPEWFSPTPVAFEPESFGTFDQAYKITKSGDVIIVPTPGHTPGHMSVLVKSEDVIFFLAGDTSYSQKLLIKRVPDGVSPRASVTLDTMDRILALARTEPLVYLPSHDPESVDRLREKRAIGESLRLQGYQEAA
jgi:glyoxylase-like metal-dependent hydrolase (beta-lactamase superfamily II)